MLIWCKRNSANQHRPDLHSLKLCLWFFVRPTQTPCCLHRSAVRPQSSSWQKQRWNFLYRLAKKMRKQHKLLAENWFLHVLHEQTWHFPFMGGTKYEWSSIVCKYATTRGPITVTVVCVATNCSSVSGEVRSTKSIQIKPENKYVFYVAQSDSRC